MAVENDSQDEYVPEHQTDEKADSVANDTVFEDSEKVAAAQASDGAGGSPTVEQMAAKENQPSVEDFAAQQDRILRLHAEMENLRNRTTREIAEQRKYGTMSMLRDILPVIDNIDRAIDSAQQNHESQVPSESATPGLPSNSALLEGFQLVRQQLLSILEDHHCKPIAALGKPFDPLFHEAILQQPSEDQPKNSVLLVTQCGYQLHDRVVQPSKVIVSSGPVETA